MARRLPIGIQSFDGMRKDGYVYVDKTAHVYKMVDEGKCYFLSRPRRFGKSLLVSTLRCYLQGRRDLFRGLEIERLEGVYMSSENCATIRLKSVPPVLMLQSPPSMIP